MAIASSEANSGALSVRTKRIVKSVFVEKVATCFDLHMSGGSLSGYVIRYVERNSRSI